ncbi:MAG: hypothetical protein AVDCRST_MAG38-2651 [uncultured Solirubrobacteraceae bacterium]|uniref:Uncharacterized protein n=1 Tax=uncultured Solirubrobacteraceae bacterium TaxID=1162706 RepID=A0A6J4S709_9ACTN|nr:MAG: hypothetical protein AVDCRST_MAG38-2651 [uncultured Solirubrobacteraceae bacterium]
MDEDALNMSTRKFLKKVGVTTQRAIELGVRERLASGELKGDETLEVEAVVTVRGLKEPIVVPGQIKLD